MPENDTGKTVLIIEDDPAFQKIIVKKLETIGVNSVTAVTAQEGWDQLENNKIDLIWLDHYLKGEETGYDFVSKVKKEKRFKKIPIFVVTNFDDYSNTVVFLERLASEKDTKTYLEFGIDKYFVKSNTTLDTILNEVKKYLRI